MEGTERRRELPQAALACPSLPTVTRKKPTLLGSLLLAHLLVFPCNLER